MASKKFTQFVTANNTSETEISIGVKSGDNFKRLNFLTATTNPTANDDNSDGYTVGSIWFNASTGTMYICKDSTVGAAVWALQAASGTWTPTFNTFIDAITAATLNSATYIRVGNIVSCSITLSLDFDFSINNTGSVIFTLPFVTTSGAVSGSLSSSNISKQFNGAVRGSDSTSGRISMQSEDASLVGLGTFHVLFQYEVN